MLTCSLISGSGQMELGVAKQRLICSLSKCSDWIRDGGSDLHWSVACLLEIQSGSVPKSAISFSSTVVALSGSLALETCVICWRTFAWWLGTLNLLLSSLGKLQVIWIWWVGRENQDFSLEWSKRSQERDTRKRAGLPHINGLPCCSILFSLFSLDIYPWTCSSKSVLQQFNYEKPESFVFFCSHLDKTSLLMTA